MNDDYRQHHVAWALRELLALQGDDFEAVEQIEDARLTLKRVHMRT